MNIALPAITIILGLLPGIVFFHGYFSGRFSKRLAAISGVSELALYVLFAVPIDALVLKVLSWFGIQLDFDLIAQLLLGQNTNGQTATLLSNSIRDSWAVAGPAYFLVLVVAFLAGNVIRRLVWTLRLDVHFPFFRMRHQWYYVLQGRLPRLPRLVWPLADVLIQNPEGTQLYRGYVSNFEVDQQGNIGQLILRAAQKDQGATVPGGRWKPIEGDQFIIIGPAIRSINMTYIVPQITPAKKATLRQRIWRTLRRVFLEES